jgi:putative addiction module component (TIGR02574 family)
MTLRVLEKEVLHLPARSRVRLAEKIIESVGDFTDPEIESSWNAEIEQRVEQIHSGVEKGIPAAQVFKNARRTLNEARRLSPARRK